MVFFSSIIAQGNRSENLVKHDYNPYHFGFILSFNQMNFGLKVNEAAIGTSSYSPSELGYNGLNSLKLLGINSQPVFGFTVGIVSNLKLSPLLDLRLIPSLAFGERKINYSFIGFKDGESPTQILDQKSIRSTHIDIPLYIKFKSKRAHNVRAYVLSGIKYTFDLAANSKKNKDASDKFLSLESQDWLFEAGAGFDFYLPYFKFGVELKMSYGFNDLLKTRDNFYTDGIASLKSKLFQISFTFE
jgi:hypothetical protein